MTRPLASHGAPALWPRDMAADMARFSGEPPEPQPALPPRPPRPAPAPAEAPIPEPVEARRVIRADESAFDAETARLIAARREEAERALIAARWGGGETWETMDLHERADAGRLAVAAVLVLAVAVVAAGWIGWAAGEGIGAMIEAARAAAERGAM